MLSLVRSIHIMTEPCSCSNPGWCERHKMMKLGRLFELCQSDNTKGEIYRQLWDNNLGKNSITPSTKNGKCNCNKDKLGENNGMQ